jgi:hypothetical protein
MIKFIKYLPKVLLGFKDVSDKYKEETGQGRPWYLSRTFIFSALCFIGTLITIVTGISIDPQLLNTLADNLPTLISSIVALVGAILSFLAQWKSQKNQNL